MNEGQKTKLKRIGLRVLAYITVTYIAWCIVLYMSQDRMLFPKDLAGSAGNKPANVESVSINGVEAWYAPPEQNGPKKLPAVIYFHGNAELINDQSHIIEGYNRIGVAVLLPEYPGYGRSLGKPSQETIRASALAFCAWLKARTEIDSSRIVYHGRSVGGGAAADLAAQREPAALILESTFESISGMALKYGAPPFLARNPFRNDRTVASLKAPLLIFHGINDKIIPVSHGRKLHSLAPSSEYVEYECNHNDFPGAGNEEKYWARIRQFLIKAKVLKQADAEVHAGR
jgi:uncharacterized protein